MRRRASDSSISATVSRSARFCLAAASRRACVPVRKMCRGVSDLAWRREAYKDFDARIEKLYTLREHLIAGLKPLGGVTINGSEDRTNAPQIVSASFEGVRSEVLLHALEDKGVYVSSGSACSSNHPGISGTLKGIGVKKRTSRFDDPVQSG